MQAKALLNSVAQQSEETEQVPAAAQKTTALPLLNLLQQKSGAQLEQPWRPYGSAHPAALTEWGHRAVLLSFGMADEREKAQYSLRRACLSLLYILPCITAANPGKSVSKWICDMFKQRHMHNSVVT